MDEISCGSSESESFHISSLLNKNFEKAFKDQESFEYSLDDCFEQWREKVESSSSDESFEILSVKIKSIKVPSNLNFHFWTVQMSILWKHQKEKWKILTCLTWINIRYRFHWINVQSVIFQNIHPQWLTCVTIQAGKKYTDKGDKVQPISSTFPYVK